MRQEILILLTGVMLCEADGGALRCYVCGPADDQKGCEDPFSYGLKPKECAQSSKFCSKTITQKGKTEILARECLLDCEETKEDRRAYRRRTCCAEDACNIGARNTIIYPGLALAVACTTLLRTMGIV